jgi:hypothetical protein
LRIKFLGFGNSTFWIQNLWVFSWYWWEDDDKVYDYLQFLILLAGFFMNV